MLAKLTEEDWEIFPGSSNADLVEESIKVSRGSVLSLAVPKTWPELPTAGVPATPVAHIPAQGEEFSAAMRSSSLSSSKSLSST